MLFTSLKKIDFMKYLYIKANKIYILTIIMLFLLILVSYTSFLLQTQKKIYIQNINQFNFVENNQNIFAVSSPKSMNFVLWFMGSKQDLNSTLYIEGENTKKQVITSGAEPNRLLIKVFLKMAVNFDSRVV